METRTLKRVTAWLLALMVALVVAPGMAFADAVDTMAEGPEIQASHDTSKDDVAWTDQATEEQQAEKVLTVYTKYADEDAISAKQFTRSDLMALAEANEKQLGYAYQNAVYVVDKYVTVAQLMKTVGKKGLTITDQDTVVFADSSGPFSKGIFTNEAFTTNDGAGVYPGFNTVGKFFPSVTYDGEKWSFNDLSYPMDAPAIIALSYAEGKWKENANEAAAAICNGLQPYYGGSLRLFSGTTAELLSGDSAALPMGKVSPSGIVSITVATPASDAFTVYSQEGASAEPKVAKEYTRAALEALATDGAKGFLFGGDTWNIGVTTKSIAIEALLKDAGLTLEEGDSLVFAAPDGFKSTFTYDAIQSEKYFYPATAEAATDASNPLEVGTVLALNWKTAAVAGTAGVTMTDLAAGALTNQYRVFCGLSEANYLAKEGIGGNRFATDPKTLTIIKAEKADEPTGGDAAPAPAAAVPAAQTVTAKAKTIALKAKALKKKAQTIKAAKVTKGNKAKTKLTYKLVKANKSKAKFKVASSGKITVKKGLKKGTYKLTIKATAAASSKYKQAVKNFVVTIKVK